MPPRLVVLHEYPDIDKAICWQVGWHWHWVAREVLHRPRFQEDCLDTSWQVIHVREGEREVSIPYLPSPLPPPGLHSGPANEYADLIEGIQPVEFAVAVIEPRVIQWGGKNGPTLKCGFDPRVRTWVVWDLPDVPRQMTHRLTCA